MHAKADPLQETLEDLDVATNWIYDDLEEGRELARQTGKPLLVTFRCVPCEACSGFDAKVRKNDSQIREVLRKFIAVRLVQMKGVDLEIFQFDYDQSWTAFFMHADGTVYGRYGTPVKKDPMAYNSMASFQKALKRALTLHKEYPDNRARLQGKQGKSVKWKYARQIPALEGKHDGPTTKNNCIHCHMVYDGYQETAQNKGTFDKNSVRKRYPLPDNIGLIMDRDEGIVVRTVLDGSPAQRAGIRPGDRIMFMEGQSILSQADMQWVLHHLPDSAKLSILLDREGRGLPVSLKLQGNWKLRDVSWRASLYSIRPKKKWWAPEISDRERKELGMDPDVLALRVHWIPDKSTAHEAGLLHDDLIVGIDGDRQRRSINEVAAYVRFEHEPGDVLGLTVMREGREIELTQELE